MLLRNGRRTSRFPVNINGQQAEFHNLHVEPNDIEDIDMANKTLKDIPRICVRHYKKEKLMSFSQIKEGMIHIQLLTTRDGETTLISDIRIKPYPLDLSKNDPNHMVYRPPQQNLNAENKTHTMLEQMMKMMSDQKKETDGRFQALESTVKQLQTSASSTDVNLVNLQAQVNNRLPSQPVANPRDNVSVITLRSGKELRPILKKVQNSDEEDETEVKRVRFSDRTEESLALPKVDLQPSQAASKEVRKSRLQQATVSRDATEFEQETQTLEPQVEGKPNTNVQQRSYVPKAPFPQRLRKEKSDDEGMTT
ncbi:hypothetical protein GOBAR_DD31925 [Gossypium barbadense]|nr:hypothetical protein GOBAR_DD31925 [Gossypium barbadense]